MLAGLRRPHTGLLFAVVLLWRLNNRPTSRYLYQNPATTSPRRARPDEIFAGVRSPTSVADLEGGFRKPATKHTWIAQHHEAQKRSAQLQMADRLSRSPSRWNDDDSAVHVADTSSRRHMLAATFPGPDVRSSSSSSSSRAIRANLPMRNNLCGGHKKRPGSSGNRIDDTERAQRASARASAELKVIRSEVVRVAEESARIAAHARSKRARPKSAPCGKRIGALSNDRTVSAAAPRGLRLCTGRGHDSALHTRTFS
jgi:hypothetical protein